MPEEGGAMRERIRRNVGLGMAVILLVSSLGVPPASAGTVREGKSLAEARLTIGGIVSDQPIEVLGQELKEVRAAMEGLGYVNNNVIMSMSTLCLPVSPKLKLTDHGLLTVPGQEHVPLIEKYGK